MRSESFPYAVDGGGRTALSAPDDHIRDLIEQVLFTTPGERVNRPTFGSGLLQLVFAPTSDALAATAQVTVSGALQQWIGDLIELQDVVIESRESTINVTVKYLVRRTQQQRVAEFSRPV